MKLDEIGRTESFLELLRCIPPWKMPKRFSNIALRGLVDPFGSESHDHTPRQKASYVRWLGAQSNRGVEWVLTIISDQYCRWKLCSYLDCTIGISKLVACLLPLSTKRKRTKKNS